MQANQLQHHFETLLLQEETDMEVQQENIPPPEHLREQAFLDNALLPPRMIQVLFEPPHSVHRSLTHLVTALTCLSTGTRLCFKAQNSAFNCHCFNSSRDPHSVLPFEHDLPTAAKDPISQMNISIKRLRLL